MSDFLSMRYTADCGRGSGRESVVCVLLTSPAHVLDKQGNLVLQALAQSGVTQAIGLYFYRFCDPLSPFIKIGECTRVEGIGVRFQRGWHGTTKYSDSYLGKKKAGSTEYGDSELLRQVRRVSPENPAYFVFYEHATMQSHPKIDEIYAYRMHKRLFDRGTLSPERMNANPLLARRLVWHRAAFAEVCRAQFPAGWPYPAPSGSRAT